MKTNIKARIGCGATALLLVASCWAANLTMGNWWAAGGPPTPEPARSAYLERGNFFFWITCVGVLSAVSLGLWSWLRIRRASSEGGTGGGHLPSG